MQLTGLDIAIYVRKSRADIENEKQAAENGQIYDTLAKHRQELLTIARRDNHRILDIYEEVVTGDYIVGRKEMQKLLDNILAMKYEAVLVIDVDRLGRGDKMDQGKIERVFRESQTLILTPSEVIDLNVDSGEFNMEVKSFLARMEYRQIKKRLYQGRVRSVTNGKDVAFKPPYGFRKDNENYLIIDKEQARYVRMIYSWCAEGLGLVRIAERLTDIGAATPSGKAVWSHGSVRMILENPKYKGTQAFARNKFYKREDGSYRIRQAHADEVVTKEKAHPGIVSEETWSKANEVLQRRKRLPLRKNVELVNPLAGLVQCSRCGSTMMAHNPSNRPHVYLYCRTKGCQTKSINVSKVYNTVLEQIEYILDSIKPDTSQRTAEMAEDRVRQLSAEYNELLQQKDHYKQKRENLYSLLEDGTYTKDLFLERSRKLHQEENELQEAIEDKKEQIEHAKVKLDLRRNAVPSLESALTVLEGTPSIEEKNRILKSILKKVVYKREKDWKKPYQFEIEIHLFE
jgi:site-specific DNA recombinase